MSYGSTLDINFRSLTSTRGQLGEIKLFRYLSNSISSSGRKYAVYEYHGSKNQVIYPSSSPWAIAGNVRCELCDLKIISYRTFPFEVRVTYLQNKVDDDVIKLKNFKGNMKQWELLANRPNITGVGRFNPPVHLLKGASLPSVGSFGVFYRDSGSYSMVYSIAECINPFTPKAKSVVRKLCIAGRYGQVRNISGHKEVEACNNIEHFGNHLSNMEIGTVIYPGTDLGKYLYNLMINLQKSNKIDDSPVISNLFDLLKTNEYEGSDEYSNIDLNLIVICTDSLNED